MHIQLRETKERKLRGGRTCQEDGLDNGDKDEGGSQLHEAVAQLCDALGQQIVHVICVLHTTKAVSSRLMMCNIASAPCSHAVLE